MAFRGRTVLGDDFLWNDLNFLRTPSNSQQSWWTSHLVAGRQALDYFGYNTWDPRLIHLGMAPINFPIPFPTVQTPPLSETDPLADDADLGGGVKVITSSGSGKLSSMTSEPKTILALNPHLFSIRSCANPYFSTTSHSRPTQSFNRPRCRITASRKRDRGHPSCAASASASCLPMGDSCPPLGAQPRAHVGAISGHCRPHA